MTEQDLDDVARRWTAAMRAGDWEAAWRQTDRIELARRAAQAQGDFVRGPQHLVWNGQPLAGRSVLVRCLHGLGDTLQFMRFVPLLARQARELHFLVQPELLALLQGAPGLGQVGNAWTDHPPAHEVEIEVMEQPYALRCTAATLPPPGPALAASVHERQGFVLPADPGLLKVGLVWSASGWDGTRSMPLDALAPLLRLPGLRFYSLQQGDAAQAQTDRWPAVVPLHRHTGDALAAAAAMLALDLVITIDGMPAHLAGTLGRPTWLLLKHEADWRWGQQRTDTPWYPGMRLFRQPAPGDWTGLVEELAGALAGEASSSQSRGSPRP